ncbi:threonine/serine exporter family protein [Citroniella saccharovorans]|uniref:Threonine/serine exporter family protein n=1 Tax=Citroniella saccharovorans TaxID=2053367 RepID=A0AAW9MV21_9FIRM|nr:threonine/serine exporter family protein [Citroniella saccharovorans]MEB3429946.1 threonine/serine exporter family protein [Citroniella saccharovorans]
MDIIFEFVIMAISVVSFAYAYNIPPRSLLAVGLTGGVSWIIYSLLRSIDKEYLGVFLASLTIGTMAIFFSKKHKLPSTVYIIPSIIPLVPGMSLYFTMYNIVMENYNEAFLRGIYAIATAGLLACGIIVSMGIKSNVDLILNRFRKN